MGGKARQKIRVSCAKASWQKFVLAGSPQEVSELLVYNLLTDGTSRTVVLQNMHTCFSCLSSNISDGLLHCPSTASISLEVVCRGPPHPGPCSPRRSNASSACHMLGASLPSTFVGCFAPTDGAARTQRSHVAGSLACCLAGEKRHHP